MFFERHFSVDPAGAAQPVHPLRARLGDVASIMPGLPVASHTSIIQKNGSTGLGGFDDDRSFLTALEVAALVVPVLSNAFIVLTRWAMEWYSWGPNHGLSCRLLQSYLYWPYEHFLTRNSAELGKNLLKEVREVTDQMLSHLSAGRRRASWRSSSWAFCVFVRGQLDVRGEAQVEANTKRYYGGGFR